MAALAALLALGGLRPAAAQMRPPLFGIWSGHLSCGATGGRNAMLFMYGNQTGLLELGPSDDAPGVGPAVAMVSLNQPPEADVVSIDRWMSNGVEPRPLLVGRLGPDGSFSGNVQNDAHCAAFTFALESSRPYKLRNMARDPERTAQMEADKLNPHWSANDAVAAGILGYAIFGNAGGGAALSGGGGGGITMGNPTARQGAAVELPRVQGNGHGNLDKDVQGNGLKDWHGNDLEPLRY